jgi:hypothetical protein
MMSECAGERVLPAASRDDAIVAGAAISEGVAP